VEARQPDHLAGQLRDDYAIARRREPLEPPAHGIRLRRIAELTEQLRDRGRIVRPGVPDQRAAITTGAHGCPLTSSTTCPAASFGVTVNVRLVTDTSE